VGCLREGDGGLMGCLRVGVGFYWLVVGRVVIVGGSGNFCIKWCVLIVFFFGNIRVVLSLSWEGV